VAVIQQLIMWGAQILIFTAFVVSLARVKS